MGDLGVGEFAGKAVGGEQVEVAGLGGVGGDLGLDRGLRADGAGDDVADGRGGGLDPADEAGRDLLLDERVVAGELVKIVAAATLLANVALSAAAAATAMASAAAPGVRSPEVMASLQNARPLASGARLNRLSKTAVTKLSAVAALLAMLLPYKATDSLLVPKESTSDATAGLVP